MQIHRVKDIVLPAYWSFPVANGEIKPPEEPSRLPFEDARAEAEGDEDALEDWQYDKRVGHPETAPASHDSDVVQPLMPSGGTPPPDFWSTSGEYLVRHHINPRTEMYTPGEDCPFPTKWLDVHRETTTNIDLKAEKCIKDYWWDSKECR